MRPPHARQQPAANPPYRLPPPLFDARCKACWFSAGCCCWWWPASGALDLQWAQFLSPGRGAQHGPLPGRVLPARPQPGVPAQGAAGAWETLAMSALGTVLAAAAGLALALPASRLHEGDRARGRARRGCC
jgi:phosphonate transport system permease protein